MRWQRWFGCLAGTAWLAALPLVASSQEPAETQAEAEAGTEGYSYSASHERDGLKIEVSVDAGEPEAGGSFDITLAREGDVFSRFSARRTGRIDGSWITDLNHNDRFEVVVTTLPPGPGGYAGVQIYEWSPADHALLPIRLAPLEGKLAARYRGDDRFRIEKDRLVWEFPSYDPGKPSSETPGDTEVLHYDFKDNEWKGQRRLLFWR